MKYLCYGLALYWLIVFVTFLAGIEHGDITYGTAMLMTALFFFGMSKEY